METSIIRVDVITKERLTKLKIHAKQSFNEVIVDLLNLLNVKYDELPEKEDVEKASTPSPLPKKVVKDSVGDSMYKSEMPEIPKIHTPEKKFTPVNDSFEEPTPKSEPKSV